MSLAEQLLQEFTELSDEKKREVIDFIEFLKKKEQEQLIHVMDAIIEENRLALEELGR